MMRTLFLAAVLAAPCISLAADVVGVITILEGQALIYRGGGRLHAAEGVRIASGDIVETAAASFAQIEMADQSVAQFGPSTRLMISGPAPRQKAGRSIYMIDGWIKLVSPKRDAGAEPGFELRSAQFEIAPSPSVIVLRSAPSGVDLFVESGSVRIGERQPGSNAAGTVSLKAGDFYQRKVPARGNVASVSPPAFVGDMPRPFRDSLPPRIERFRERQVQPKDAPAFAYADVEAWLQAEPAVRRPLMQRWRSKAQEPPFRAALVAHLSVHPEWDPILFPEKYKPKEPPLPAATVRPAASDAASTPQR
jgi:FecR protein